MIRHLTSATTAAAALASIVLLTSACTGSSGADKHSTAAQPAPVTSPPVTSPPTRQPAINLVPAGKAGMVTVTAVPHLRAKVAAHQNTTLIALPDKPGTPSTRNHAVFTAGRSYVLPFAVDVARGRFGIRMVATNADLSGLTPFLGTAGHRYHITASLTPSAGRGFYKLQTLDPVTGQVLTSARFAFTAH